MGQDEPGEMPGCGERTAPGTRILSRRETSHFDMCVYTVMDCIMVVAQGGSQESLVLCPVLQAPAACSTIFLRDWK